VHSINNTGNIGKVLHALSEVASTNTYAQELIAKSAPVEGTVILAEHQLQGRGQTGNVWDSAAGMNVLMSVILKPIWLPLSDQFYLNMSVALAVREVLQILIPKEKVEVKWPNDILINEQKVAGILIENVISGHKIVYSVVGIGVNVNQQIFSDTITRATSLRLVNGQNFEVLAIAKKLMIALDKWYALLRNRRFGEVKSTYLKYLFRYQEVHKYVAKGETVSAQILGVGPQGKLVLEESGKLTEYWMQEVSYVYEE